MTSRNVDPKRLTTDDEEVPAELSKREAQDRAKPTEKSGGARSPVDSMHVDAPKHRGNSEQ
jgi:hypothetical protein